MNKFASVQVVGRNGTLRNTVITSEQMAQIGIAMGWIKPIGPYAMKLAKNVQIHERRVLVKTASGTRKMKMGVERWLELSLANGWVAPGMDKVAGFFSAIGDLAGSAVNAVGNAYQGAKNMISGAQKYVTDAAGRVFDSAGRAVAATVNAAGQVVDQGGKVLGQAARAAGDLGASAVNAAGQAGQAVAQGARGAANAVGQLAGSAVNAAGQGVQNAMTGAQAAGRFVVDSAGKVRDAAGNAVNATVNAAGQVVDATGKVVGQAARYVGQLAGEAKAGYDARRQAGDTNFAGAAGQLIQNSPQGIAAQGLGYGATQAVGAIQNAGRQVAQGYNAARARTTASVGNGQMVKMSRSAWMDMGRRNGWL